MCPVYGAWALKEHDSLTYSEDTNGSSSHFHILDF
jgi:hypothetical protein